jgi:molecular chaperone GrpE
MLVLRRSFGLRLYSAAAPATAAAAAEATAGTSASAGTTEPTAPPTPTVADLQKEIESLKSKNLYFMAEVENSRLRYERLTAAAQDFAVESLARQILPVADNIRRTVQSGKSQSVESILSAVSILDSELHQILAKFKIEMIRSKDADFSPQVHDAISTVEAPEKAGKVVEVVQEGYTLAGRLLRAAKVIVGK